MKLFNFITPSLYFFSALADTCPPVKDIAIQCTGPKCDYSAATQSGTWKGNNKNPSHELLDFNFARFRASERSDNATLKGKISYCTYGFPNNQGKNLRLFPEDKSKSWHIKGDQWENLENHDNYLCRGNGDVEKCPFTP